MRVTLFLRELIFSARRFALVMTFPGSGFDFRHLNRLETGFGWWLNHRNHSSNLLTQGLELFLVERCWSPSHFLSVAHNSAVSVSSTSADKPWSYKESENQV